MMEGVNNTDAGASNYSMTYDDFQTVSSLTSTVVSVDDVPVGYLVLTQYSSPHCNGELAFQFSYPVGVCVNYGFVSEKVTVIQLGPVLIITIARYHGMHCHLLIYSHAVYIVHNNLCASPFELTYSTELPAADHGIIEE
jgi:hypothetical protein